MKKRVLALFIVITTLLAPSTVLGTEKGAEEANILNAILEEQPPMLPRWTEKFSL